jgi:hypothetical protein
VRGETREESQNSEVDEEKAKKRILALLITISIAPRPAVTVATRPGSMVSPRQTCWRRGLRAKKRYETGEKVSLTRRTATEKRGEEGQETQNALISRRLERNVIQRPLEVVRDGEGRVEEDDVVHGRRGGNDDAGDEHSCEHDMREGQYGEENEGKKGCRGGEKE